MRRLDRRSIFSLNGKQGGPIRKDGLALWSIFVNRPTAIMRKAELKNIIPETPKV